MLTARAADGKRIPAANDDGSKNTAAWCPCCGKPMVARVGTERRPHWAHKSAERCDEWWEVESDWHIEWRKRFLDAAKPNVKIEVEHVLEKDGGRHFSDVRIDDRLSIILRRARMDDAMKSERLAFFGDLIWLVQAKKSEYNRLIRQQEESELLPVVGLKACNVCASADKSFFSSWKNARCLVVFDFRLASGWDSEKLRVVVPGGGLSRNIVCLGVDDFVERIVTTGSLFRKTNEEVNAEFYKRRRLASRTENHLLCCMPQATGLAQRQHSSYGAMSVHVHREEPTSVRHVPPEHAYPAVPTTNHVHKVSRPSETPRQQIWPEDFNRTVTLALTVDPVLASLISQGRISEIETTSIIDGDAAAVGRCALHSSTECSTQALYWAKRRIANAYGASMLAAVQPDAMLKGNSGSFLGTVEYSVKERPSGKVTLRLRNFNPIPPIPPHHFSRECLWSLASDQLRCFA